MCVFANQIYRGYEAYYTNDKNKIKEAIGYLKQALKEKGFCESYRKTGVKKVSLDKTVFLMYAIEMMINISRGYNVIGEFDKALENELDIAYIYDLLNKQGICFYSQEFQFNTIYGTTLLRLGNIKEANDILTKALNNVENVSSDIDLVAAYVAKAEVNIKLGNYEKAIEDCDKALKLKNLYSNYYLLEKCKSLYFRIVANYKLNLPNKCKKDFYEFSLEAKKLRPSKILCKGKR